MSRINRRNYLQGAMGAAAALPSLTPAAAAQQAAYKDAFKTYRTKPSGTPGLHLALMVPPGRTAHQKLSAQVGLTHSIVNVNGALRKVPRTEYVRTLTAIKEEFAAYGLKIPCVESHPVPAEKIKLGLPGRDEEIENYIAAIKALAEVGIPIVCYNFMAGIGWFRTNTAVKGRGGALISEFDNEVASKQGLTEWGEVSEEKIWSNMEYFLKAVIPVAEKYNVKMALHPDDPPMSPLRGIGRILISARNFDRVMNIVPSPVNGVTFCQANFVAMGEDIEAVARRWMAQKKIFFIHFRDITGRAHKFQETFHDNGQTDMARMVQVFYEGGYSGPIRPDHAPTMEGESNDNPGYAVFGRLWAIGYIKGLCEMKRLPYV